MKPHRIKLYLEHILECIALLPQHLSLLPPSLVWHEQPTVRDAVLRTLQIMSESCQRLPETVKAGMPNIAWQDISGFRNILVHDYLGSIEYSTVTFIMETKLPELNTTIEQYYKSHYG